MKHSLFSCSARLVVTLVLGAITAYGQTAGELDLTFGTSGKVQFTLPSHSLEAREAVVAADGSIYVVGTAQATDAPEFRPFVAKFTAAGVLDSTFGPGGYVMLPLAHDFHGRAIAMAADGSLRIAGHSLNCFNVIALASDGSLLTSFGTNGMAYIIIGPRSEVRDMGLQGDGSVVVAGHADWIDTAGTPSTRTAMQLARFTSTGTADTTFGTAGIVSNTATTGSLSASCVLVQPDGQILVGGDTGTAASSTAVVARFASANGALDTTFDADGIWTNAATGAVVALTTETSGRITILAKAIGGAGITMARMSSAGVLDTTFSSDGLASFTATETPGALALRTSDARIFLAGTHSNAGTIAWSLRRVQPDGANDANFNSGNPILTTMGSNFGDGVSNLLRLSDGKLLMIGHTRTTASDMTMSLGLARFHPGADETNVAPPTITTQPANLSLAPGATATFTVEHTGGVATYQWMKDGSILAGKTSATLSLSRVLMTQQGAYSVTITNAYGTITSNPAQLTVSGEPMIIAQPGSLAGPIGLSDFTTIHASGAFPLTFEWRKDTTVVATHIFNSASGFSSSDSISFVGATSENGTYTCRISNSEGSVTSDPFTVLFRPLNTIIFTPADSLVSEGAVVTLTPDLLTQSTTFLTQWLKDGKVIADTTEALNRDLVTLADGGTYICKIGTLAGIVTSAATRLSVVESKARKVAAAAGKPVSITALTSGPGLTYRWYRGTTPLNNGGRFTGTDKATLTIATTNGLTDNGIYTCLVTSAWGESKSTGEITLVVESVKPTVDPVTFDHGRVASLYSAAVTASNTPSKFAATGLPPGLLMDPVTGEIEGIPTTPGTYSVKITATNPVGTSAVVTAPLVIDPLSVQGVYNGIVKGSAGDIGTFTMTVAVNGSYTGKAIVGVFAGPLYTLSFTGAFTEDPDTANSFTSRSNPIAVPPTVFIDGPYFIDMTQSGTDKLQATLRSSGEDSFNIAAFRNPWNATKRPATAYAGYYTTSLDVSSWSPAPTGANGHGYAGVTATTAGTFTLTGKLPDNTAISMSGYFDDDGSSWFFQWLYGNKGAFSGEWALSAGTGPLYSDAGIGGSLSWTRPPMAGVPEGVFTQPYIAGFYGSSVSMSGARYLPPGHADTTSNLMMDANPGTDNISVSISGGQLDFDFQTRAELESPATYSSSATLKTNHTATFPAYFAGDEFTPPDSVRFTSLGFNASTGTYSGAATVYQFVDVEKPDGSIVTTTFSRAVTFYGMVSRSDSSLSKGAGWGYYFSTAPYYLYDDGGNLVATYSVLVTGASEVTPAE